MEGGSEYGHSHICHATLHTNTHRVAKAQATGCSHTSETNCKLSPKVFEQNPKYSTSLTANCPLRDAMVTPRSWSLFCSSTLPVTGIGNALTARTCGSLHNTQVSKHNECNHWYCLLQGRLGSECALSIMHAHHSCLPINSPSTLDRCPHTNHAMYILDAQESGHYRLRTQLHLLNSATAKGGRFGYRRHFKATTFHRVWPLPTNTIT